MNTPEIIAVYQSGAPPLTADFAHPAWQVAERLPLKLNWMDELDAALAALWQTKRGIVDYNAP